MKKGDEKDGPSPETEEPRGRGGMQQQYQVGGNRRGSQIALDKAGLSFLSLKGIATIDIKAHEPGLAAFALKFNLPLVTFTPEELNRVPDVTPSEAAQEATGAQAVAEPAAIMGSNGGKLLAHKLKKGNVTVAVAEAGQVALWAGVNSRASERGQ